MNEPVTTLTLFTTYDEATKMWTAQAKEHDYMQAQEDIELGAFRALLTALDDALFTHMAKEVMGLNADWTEK